jgi:hypothetical protein
LNLPILVQQQSNGKPQQKADSFDCGLPAGNDAERIFLGANLAAGRSFFVWHVPGSARSRGCESAGSAAAGPRLRAPFALVTPGGKPNLQPSPAFQAKAGLFLLPIGSRAAASAGPFVCFGQG